MGITGWLILIGVVGLILLILAIVWKPSRVAIGAILVVLGIMGIITAGFLGIGFIVGIPMLFIGVIFMVTGLRK